jgi:hypothetical protein
MLPVMLPQTLNRTKWALNCLYYFSFLSNSEFSFLLWILIPNQAATAQGMHDSDLFYLLSIIYLVVGQITK